MSLGNDGGPMASSNGMQYSDTVTGRRYGNFVASKHTVNDGIDSPIIGGAERSIAKVNYISGIRYDWPHKSYSTTYLQGLQRDVQEYIDWGSTLSGSSRIHTEIFYCLLLA